MSKRVSDDGFVGVAQGLLDAIQAMKQLASQLHENASALGHLEQRAISLEMDVGKLYTIMFEGDGKPSVAAQFMLLTSEMTFLKDEVNQLKTLEETLRRERIRSWTAILVALIAAAGVVAGAILR